MYGATSNRVVALNAVDLSIDRGEFVAIMGPSGSGKTTCLSILGLLDKLTSGGYRFRNLETDTLGTAQLALVRRRFFGFVFQDFSLIDRATALENVELPLIYQRVPAAERLRRARATLDQLGLLRWASHQPRQLSGGQQQRVAIARALVVRPLVIFADEPTGNLDSENGAMIIDLLVSLNRDLGVTTVMVTHDPGMARRAQRIIQFTDGRVTSDESVRGDLP